MRRVSKHSQLQIRVSEEEKEAIRRAAERAGMDMSAYVLSRVLPAAALEFQACLQALSAAAAPSFALAELNTLLSSLGALELREVIAARPQIELPPFLANYVAAMVEVACAQRAVPLPAWTRAIVPLDEPAFGSALQSLRLHLLTHSPAAFRRRNIFVDSTLGDRV
jgi:mobilization protein NikA